VADKKVDNFPGLKLHIILFLKQHPALKSNPLIMRKMQKKTEMLKIQKL